MESRSQSFEYSKQGGVISIDITRKKIKNKDDLIITIKDDSYHVSTEYKNKFRAEKFATISPLQLNSHTIKNIIEAHHGTLAISYTKLGKIISLTLPYNSTPSRARADMAIEGGNIVFLKKA